MLILKERARNVCLQSEREITITTDTKDSLLADHHLTKSHVQLRKMHVNDDDVADQLDK